MDMGWLESLLYGLLSGFTEFVPVSSQAHGLILRRLFGCGESHFLNLMIHFGMLISLWGTVHPQMDRLRRERRLASIPKRRRKRQPDAIALMDDRLLRTAAVPMLLMFLAFTAMDKVSGDLLRISVLFILNGIILYVPRLRPSGNKDSRMLTPFDGVIFGLASGFGILPGFSRMGAYMSVASLRGADRQHSLGMALILGIPALAAMLVMDLVWLILAGFAGFSLILVLKGILAAAAAYIGTWFGITFVRFLSVKKGYSVFAYYCWGAALFVFILYLMI